MIDELLNEATQHRARGDVDSAIAVCRRAIAHAPNDPRGYSRLAHLALEAFEYDEARSAFANAARLAPYDIGYLNNFGMTLVYAGDFDAAREQFRRAIALDPACAPSYYNLAPIAPLPEAAGLVHTLEGLKNRAATDFEQSLIGFALGKLYDDLGDWDLAFENFRLANRKRGAAYDHNATLSFLLSSRMAYSADALQTSGARKRHSQVPVFIVGMPRSGSSLVEELLVRRSGAFGLGERPDIANLAAMLGKRHSTGLGYPNCVPHLVVGEWDEMAARYLESVNRQAKGAPIIIDKQLMNFQFTPFLATMFPASPIVHCMRNPIDTCLSAFFTNFQVGHSYSFDLADLGLFYRAYHDYMEHWRRLLPAAPINLQYEELVRDSDAALAGLEARLGEVQTLNPGASPAASRNIRTSSAFQVRQPVYSHAVARWKNYEKHLGPLIDALGDLAQR